MPSTLNISDLDKNVKLDDLSIPDTVKRVFPRSGASEWIGRQPNDPKPIFYCSSVVGAKGYDEDKFYKLTKHGFRCFSYSYCGYESPFAHNRHLQGLNWCLDNDVRVFMDSGAHSFHNLSRFGKTLMKKWGINKEDRLTATRKLITNFTDMYIRYIKWNYSVGRKFDFYVTLDAEKDCSKIYKMTKNLQKKGIWPIPVYHGDDSLDWVRRYIGEGHKLLGVGMDRRGKPTKDAIHRYYDSVFNLTEKHGVSCHGFAMTGDGIFRWPWYSVDSTTYLKAAGYGKILQVIPERQRIAEIHISSTSSSSTPYGNAKNLTPAAYNYLRDSAEKLGFDFDKLRDDFTLRAIYNVKVMHKAIDLHTKRGIKWTAWKSIL